MKTNDTINSKLDGSRNKWDALEKENTCMEPR
jgi:hypothetical protein